MRVRAVATLAVDRDFDTIGARHRRARRDAVRPGGKPRLCNANTCSAEALEEPSSIIALAPVALLAGLEDQVRDAVEVTFPRRK
jgi:hypothetical protein